MLKRVKGPQRAVEQGKGTVEDVKDALSGDHDGAHGRSDDHDAAVQTAKVGATTVMGTRAAGRD